MCMQPPVGKKAENGGMETGMGALGTGGGKRGASAAKEALLARAHYVQDLAKNKMWAAIVDFAKANPEVSMVSFYELVKAMMKGGLFWREDNEGRRCADGMNRAYHPDADRVLEYIATEAINPEVGLAAVSFIALMGGVIGGTRARREGTGVSEGGAAEASHIVGGVIVVPQQILCRVAEGAFDEGTASAAMDALRARGAKHQLRWLAEDPQSGANEGRKARAAELFKEMEESDLECAGHGC